MTRTQQDQQERVWSRGVTLWQATLATISLFVVIGGAALGGLMSIKMDIHDLNGKLATFKEVTDQVQVLRAWKDAHTIENNTNVTNIQTLQREQERIKDKLERVDNDQTVLNTRFQVQERK